LTPTEKIQYGKFVQQMMSLLKTKATLAKQLSREPILSGAAQVDISVAELDETIRRGQQAKQKMISANLRLVVAVAKVSKRNLELLDLIQEGTWSYKGVEKFDPSRVSFLYLLFHWIRQAITRVIANHHNPVANPCVKSSTKLKGTTSTVPTVGTHSNSFRNS